MESRLSWHVSCFNLPEGGTMIETIAVFLIILYFLGLSSAYPSGDTIHLLLGVVLVLLIVRGIQRRRLI